jgi:hypothetical protein
MPPGFGNGNSEIITALTLHLPIRTTVPFRLPMDVTALRRPPREPLRCRFISPTRWLYKLVSSTFLNHFLSRPSPTPPPFLYHGLFLLCLLCYLL